VIGPSSLGGGDSRLTLLGLEARLARNAGVLGWILSCWPRRGGTLERGNPARLFSDLPADEEDQRMTRKDWALLVIAAAHGKAVSPVQLQKCLFLLGENLGAKERQTSKYYTFRAHDYGPFDRAIYDDAEELELEGLVLIYPEPSQTSRRYHATPAGLEHAQALRKGLGATATDYLDRVVPWARSLRFDELVRAIYRDYPDMKVNSVFRG